MIPKKKKKNSVTCFPNLFPKHLLSHQNRHKAYCIHLTLLYIICKTHDDIQNYVAFVRQNCSKASYNKIKKQWYKCLVSGRLYIRYSSNVQNCVTVNMCHWQLTKMIAKGIQCV